MLRAGRGGPASDSASADADGRARCAREGVEPEIGLWRLAGGRLRRSAGRTRNLERGAVGGASGHGGHGPLSREAARMPQRAASRSQTPVSNGGGVKSETHHIYIMHLPHPVRHSVDPARSTPPPRAACVRSARRTTGRRERCCAQGMSLPPRPPVSRRNGPLSLHGLRSWAFQNCCASRPVS